MSTKGIKVSLNRQRAEHLLSCLNENKAISPSDPEQGWTGDDMLALAGACYFVALSQGPSGWTSNVERFQGDMQGAICTYMQLMAQVADQEFEIEHGDYILGVATLEGEGPKIELSVIEHGKKTEH